LQFFSFLTFGFFKFLFKNSKKTFETALELTKRPQLSWRFAVPKQELNQDTTRATKGGPKVLVLRSKLYDFYDVNLYKTQAIFIIFGIVEILFY
jgi:hypothetical protein